jgi:HEPN domain-containing protein
MSPESRELGGRWLIKAQSDLASARLLITGSEKHLDTGAFHCHQTAEKSLKAWLTTREVIFPKTRSLTALVALCTTVDPAFDGLQKHAEKLTPLGTAFRYPGEELQPDLHVASQALALAEEIYTFCEKQIQDNTRDNRTTGQLTTRGPLDHRTADH